MHPVRGEHRQRQQMRWSMDQGDAKGLGWGGWKDSSREGRIEIRKEKRTGKKGSAKAGVAGFLPGNLQRGRDFGRGPRALVILH